MKNLHATEAKLIGEVLFGLTANKQTAVLKLLQPEDFDDIQHCEVWSAIQRTAAAGMSVDEHTVGATLRGSVSVSALCAFSANILNVDSAEDHARLIKRVANSRRLIDVMREQTQLLEASLADEEAALGAIRAVTQVEVSVGSKLAAWGVLVDRAVTQLKARHRGEETPFATGWSSLDKHLAGGFRRGELVIVGARTGVGKSTFGGQMAWDQARAGKSIFVASVEMTSALFLERILCRMLKIPSTVLHSGMYADHQEKLIDDAAEILKSHSNLYIASYSELTVDMLRADALRHRVAHGLDCVIVDYLQLLTGKGRDMYEQVSSVSVQLAKLAKELDVPVVAMCQLRRPEKGKEQVPTIFELRQSGQIEQDADTILLLHKDESDDLPILEVHIGKQRSGPRDVVVELMFDGPTYELREA